MQKMCVVFFCVSTCNVKYWCQVDITKSSTEHDVQWLSIAWIYIKRLQLKSFPRKSDPIIVDIVPSLPLFSANRFYKMHLQARTTRQQTTLWLSTCFFLSFSQRINNNKQKIKEKYRDMTTSNHFKMRFNKIQQ